MLDSKILTEKIIEYVNSAKSNYLDSEDAASHNVLGLKLYNEPIIGFASTDDPLFPKMKEKGVVGPQYMLPEQWLPGAKSVISFFLPFSDELRKSNLQKNDIPSNGWLFGRIEGQHFMDDVTRFIANLLKKNGYEATVPTIDPRFRAVQAPRADLQGDWEGASFTSNWSERHAAYISGLGTFGLSKGLITEKGIAGRFGSVITNAVFPATERKYSGIYDYCIKCGACARRCPVEAITIENGKDHIKCGIFQANAMKTYAPRYGCGKCQVGVPCETGIPNKKYRT